MTRHSHVWSTFQGGTGYHWPGDVPVVHILCDLVALSTVSANIEPGTTPKTKFIELDLSLQLPIELISSLISSFLQHTLNECLLFVRNQDGHHSSFHMVNVQEMRKEERMKEYDLCHWTSLGMLMLMTKHHQETYKIIFSALINVVRDT